MGLTSSVEKVEWQLELFADKKAEKIAVFAIDIN